MPVHSRVTTPSAFATGKTKRVPVKESNPVYQEDVFAQQYYEGSNSNKRIYNQIDLENKGGLIWTKQVGSKSSGYSNEGLIWIDSLMGVGKYILCNDQDEPGGGPDYPTADASSLISFNTDGYTIGTGPDPLNNPGKNYISYTFAKQEKFFTLFSYEGGADGAGTTEIAHDLGCTPGMIVVKCQSDTGTGNDAWHQFATWHRGYNNYNPEHRWTRLNQDYGIAIDNGYFPTSNGGPNATHFTVGNNLNVAGITYNVYMWGHNEAAEDCIFGEEGNKPLIFCGYCSSASNSTWYPELDCGMPAQFLMTKLCDQLESGSSTDVKMANSWRVSDKLRGLSFHNQSPWWVFPSNFTEEKKQSDQDNNTAYGDIGYRTAKGFAQGWKLKQTAVFMVVGDSAYRNATITGVGPEGTPRIKNVFTSSLLNSPGAGSEIANGYSRTLDFVINKRISSTSGSGNSSGTTFMVGRFDWKRYLKWNSTGNSNLWSFNNGTWMYRSPSDAISWYNMAGNPNANATDGIGELGGGSDMTSGWVWTMTLHQHRKFFDMQQWVGDNTSDRNIYHNLEFEPSMIWCKAYGGNENWAVYHKSLGVDKHLRLNSTEGKQNYANESGVLVSVDHEKIVVGPDPTYGNSYRWNQNSWQYAAYFFGEYPGWSKIGSYTGTGNQIDIEMGFTTGHSNGGLGCVLIKRADAGSTGDWYMWDKSFNSGVGIPTFGGTQFMRLNQTGDQYNLGNTTYINSLTSTGNPNTGHISGLTITNTAANPVNVSGAEYVYWVLSSTD